MFAKKHKSINAMNYLSKRANRNKRRMAQQLKKSHKGRRRGPLKHFKPKGSGYQFRRIETLVKNKHSQRKHWNLFQERKKNPATKWRLQRDLKGVPILLIVRLHGDRNIPAKLLSTLQSLRLFKSWDCILARNTVELRRTLRDILPFTTFGVPTAALIRDLVVKRGRLFNEEENQRAVIKSNVVVEKVLGKYGVICIEDIIDAMSTSPYPLKSNEEDGGEEEEEETEEDNDVILEDGSKISKCDRFDGVANALNPLELNRKKIPMRGLVTPFGQKGYWGYRGTHINKFVEKFI